MTNPTLERAVSALKAEIGKAFDAKPLPFAGDTGNWSARGNVQELDLEVCVRAVLMAVLPEEVDANGAPEWMGPAEAYGWSIGFNACREAILVEGE